MSKDTKKPWKSLQPWEASILKSGESGPRVCDCCNRPLVAPGGVVEDRCFLTEHGLFCQHCCLRGIPVIRGYQQGQDVSETAWYKGVGTEGGKYSLGVNKNLPRLCDYCGRILIGLDGVVRLETYLTEHEIMCQHCIGVTAAICVYSPGEDVSEQPWYTGFCL